MKIEFNFDELGATCELLDNAFVVLLKRELKNSKEFLNMDGYIHSDDKKQYKRNIKACKQLLEYYGG